MAPPACILAPRGDLRAGVREADFGPSLQRISIRLWKVGAPPTGAAPSSASESAKADCRSSAAGFNPLSQPGDGADATARRAGLPVARLLHPRARQARNDPPAGARGARPTHRRTGIRNGTDRHTDPRRRDRARDHRSGGEDPRSRGRRPAVGRADRRRDRAQGSGQPAAQGDARVHPRQQLALKGPLTTPSGTGFRSINVALRQEFELYANVRPVRTLVPGRPLRRHRPRAGAREHRGAVQRAWSTTSASAATRAPRPRA